MQKVKQESNAKTKPNNARMKRKSKKKSKGSKKLNRLRLLLVNAEKKLSSSD